MLWARQASKHQMYLLISPEQLLSDALQTASKADVIVAVLGEPAAWSGEASSLTDIGIQKAQQDASESSCFDR